MSLNRCLIWIKCVWDLSQILEINLVTSIFWITHHGLKKQILLIMSCWWLQWPETSLHKRVVEGVRVIPVVHSLVRAGPASGGASFCYQYFQYFTTGPVSGVVRHFVINILQQQIRCEIACFHPHRRSEEWIETCRLPSVPGRRSLVKCEPPGAPSSASWSWSSCEP